VCERERGERREDVYLVPGPEEVRDNFALNRRSILELNSDCDGGDDDDDSNNDGVENDDDANKSGGYGVGGEWRSFV
jgi:hypothetical protein